MYRKMKVLGIGELVLDKSCHLERFLREDYKVQPSKVTYSVGGPVASALILLSKLGIECNLVASIGNDDIGRKVRGLIKNESIQLIPKFQKQTKVNTVLLNKSIGSRTIIRSEVRHSQIKIISKRLIKESDLIIFDRHEPEAFKYVCEHKRNDTIVIVDPSSEVSSKTLKMLQMSSFPVVPVESLLKIRRHKNKLLNLKHLYKLTNKIVIVTAGPQGSMIFDGKKIKVMPAYNIKTVDTLGAGDVFRGAFGYGLLQKWSIYKTVEFANCAAALQCTRIGNGTAIPDKNEIDAFMNSTSQKEVTVSQILE